MTADDLAFVASFTVVAFGLYAGLKTIAEAIDTLSARLSRPVAVAIAPIHVHHHHHDQE